jgi:hypothetical protein
MGTNPQNQVIVQAYFGSEAENFGTWFSSTGM